MVGVRHTLLAQVFPIPEIFQPHDFVTGIVDKPLLDRHMPLSLLLVPQLLLALELMEVMEETLFYQALELQHKPQSVGVAVDNNQVAVQHLEVQAVAEMVEMLQVMVYLELLVEAAVEAGECPASAPGYAAAEPRNPWCRADGEYRQGSQFQKPCQLPGSRGPFRGRRRSQP